MATATFNVKGKDWYKNTISIDEGIEKINDEKRTRDDIMCPLKHMKLGIDTDSQIIMEYIDGREFAPTLHALKQMATWMNVSHAFLKAYTNPVLNQNHSVKFERDTQDTEILLSVFRNGIRDKRVDPEKPFRFRTYTDGTLRAMLSDRYAIIDNTWYLDSLRNTFNQIGCDEPRLMKWLGDADTIYGNMLLPDTITNEPDSDYGGMISISNCEIGRRRLSLTPSIFRSLCTNGMIFGQQNGTKYSRVHRGNVDFKTLVSDINANIANQIPTIAAGLKKFTESKTMDFAKGVSPSNIIAQLGIDHNLTQGKNGQIVTVGSEFATHEKANTNLFGLINAVTRAGQNYSNDVWVRMDEIGGSLAFMDQNDWNTFNVRAKAMDTKTRDKAFGYVVAS